MAGIRIDLDYSWFVIFFLILATFTGSVFPQFVPGLSDAAYLAMGVAGTVLFFVSLLIHELSHSFVARWKGIDVDGITLFIFGGMARTSREPDGPGDEFQIAGVGPLASLVLAGLFYGVAVMAERGGWGRPVSAVAGHMALLNLLLAVFNLLPGFPLDGGRLFRSVVWRVTGDLRRATEVATTGGRWLGYLIVALGIASLLFAGALVNGLWFIFIGWFLVQAANASYRQVLLKQVLGDRLARDAMTASPETVSPHLPVDRLVEEHFLRRPFNSFPVTEGGRVVGIVTLSQVKDVPRSEWAARRVSDVMTPVAETLVVEPDWPMQEVVQRMSENSSRRVVVARDGELLGVITGHDIARWLERASLLE